MIAQKPIAASWPRGFYGAVCATLLPGTTILVAQSAVGVGTGEPLTVMDAVVPQP